METVLGEESVFSPFVMNTATTTTMTTTTTTTTTRSAKAKGKSVATVSYVGKMGTCESLRLHSAGHEFHQQKNH